MRETQEIPGSERSLEGKWQPISYSCLEKSMDREKPGGLQSVGSMSRTELSMSQEGRVSLKTETHIE